MLVIFLLAGLQRKYFFLQPLTKDRIHIYVFFYVPRKNLLNNIRFPIKTNMSATNKRAFLAATLVNLRRRCRHHWDKQKFNTKQEYENN